MKPTLLPILALLLATRLLAADESPANGAVQTPVADAGGSVTSTETVAAKAARIAWWREARFGLFIHFGLYAIPGRGEWVQWNEQIPNEEYAKLADQFNPTSSVTAWVETAKAAGMKYIVLTARHHDGFCLFDDGTNQFTTVKSAARRDLVQEYVRAARNAGLGVGLYYSPLDWRFPGYLSPNVHRQSAEAMRDQYHRQMETLLSNYGKLDILFFDGGEADWLSFGGDWKGAEWKKRPSGQHYNGAFDWQHERVYSMLRRLQPQLIINGRADMPEDFHSREGDGAGGNFDNQHPWEHCLTLAGAWGYQKTARPKPLKDCLQYLIKAAGRDGNLLLNVGPAPDGQIDPAQAQRLREMGDWLGKYGASIYGTRGGPFLPGDYGVSTFRDKSIYVHILKWPGDRLVLPAISAKVVRAVALTGGEAAVTQTEAGIEISVPAANRDATDTIVELQLDQTASAIAPIEVPAARP